MKVWLVMVSGEGEYSTEITVYGSRVSAFGFFRRLVIEKFCENDDDETVRQSSYVQEADALPYEGGIVSNGDIHIELEAKDVN
jgi:hypothetical protein